MEEHKKQIITSQCVNCGRTVRREAGDSLMFYCDDCYKTFGCKPSSKSTLPQKNLVGNNGITKNTISDERVKVFKATNREYLAKLIEDNKMAHEIISDISYSSHYGPYDNKTFLINSTVYSAIVVYKSKL